MERVITAQRRAQKIVARVLKETADAIGQGHSGGSGDAWWDSLSLAEQKKYIAAHPGSKYAKGGRHNSADLARSTAKHLGMKHEQQYTGESHNHYLDGAVHTVQGLRKKLNQKGFTTKIVGSNPGNGRVIARHPNHPGLIGRFPIKGQGVDSGHFNHDA